MAGKNRNRVYITDRMVMTALGLGVGYWVIESLLYVFLSYRFTFMERLFGPDLGGISARIIVICLFLMFGSHAQFTINQRKNLEAELMEMKRQNETLKNELDHLKNP